VACPVNTFQMRPNGSGIHSSGNFSFQLQSFPVANLPLSRFGMFVSRGLELYLPGDRRFAPNEFLARGLLFECSRLGRGLNWYSGQLPGANLPTCKALL
jgi:hypothetical protein